MLALAAVAACNKPGGQDDPPVISKEIKVVDPASVNMLENGFDIACEGAVGTFKFVAAGSWTASVVQTKSQDGWVKVEPSSGGAGEHTLKITVEENESPEGRAAKIEIKSEDSTKEIDVSQQAKQIVYLKEVKVTPSEITLSLGERVHLAYELVPANATVNEVMWGIEQPTLVAISQDGWVTAESTGQTRVYVLVNGSKAYCNIKIEQKTTGVEMLETSIDMRVGGTHQLKCVRLPWNQTDFAEIRWSSESEEVATVDSDGLVTAVGPGSTKIKATANGHSADCEVSVTNPATSAKFSMEKISLEDGNSVMMSIQLLPERHTDNPRITWASSNPLVAQCTEEGFVTGVGLGECEIYAIIDFLGGRGWYECPCSVMVVGMKPVDLGLSVKWGSVNLGALRATDSGHYYAWGETAPKATYTWATYKWCEDGDKNKLTKYNNDKSYGTVDKKYVLDPEDDAARATLGQGWRIPSKEEIAELVDNCSWEEITVDGVGGYRVSRNGNSIFLPFTGLNGDHVSSQSFVGYYWGNMHCGDIYSESPLQIFTLRVQTDYGYRPFKSSRHHGLVIRPVHD